MIFLWLVLIILFLIFFIKGFKIIQQDEVMIIERLGKYKSTLFPGFHWINPILEQPKKITSLKTTKNIQDETISYFTECDRIDMRESIYEFPHQNIVTKNNAKLDVKLIVYFQIIDTYTVAYKVQNLYFAIERLVQVQLENIIEEMDLNDILDTAYSEEQNGIIINETSQNLGIRINRIELQDIMPLDINGI